MLRNQKIHCHRSKLIHENEKLNCKNHSGDLRFLSLQFPRDQRKKTKSTLHHEIFVCITQPNTLIKNWEYVLKWTIELSCQIYIWFRRMYILIKLGCWLAVSFLNKGSCFFFFRWKHWFFLWFPFMSLMC